VHRAGADDHQQPVVLAVQDALDLAAGVNTVSAAASVIGNSRCRSFGAMTCLMSRMRRSSLMGHESGAQTLEQVPSAGLSVRDGRGG
jgi:hypothetical protein